MERPPITHTSTHRAVPAVPLALPASSSVARVPQPLAWRLGNRLLNRDVVNCAFRVMGGAKVAAGMLDRFVPIGLTHAASMETLSRVRAWDQWHVEWQAYAARVLAERTPLDQADDARASRDRTVEAALALHIAQLFVTDVALKRTLHTQAAATFREVAPLLDPPAVPFTLAWRGEVVPGYLSLPSGAGAGRSVPLVVFLNGGSTSKEELTGWRAPFLARGFATLALDNPGTGETWGAVSYAPNQHPLLDDLRRAVAAHPALDGRVALVGVSLGGMLAVDLAVEAPDLAAVVTVTTPFAPGEYLTEMAPLTQWEVAHVTGFPPDCLPYLCHVAGLAPRAPRLFMPTLVIGAGRDWIVPPREAKRLYDACVAPRTLHWYPRASHCCFSHLSLMLTRTAQWLARVMPIEG